MVRQAEQEFGAAVIGESIEVAPQSHAGGAEATLTDEPDDLAFLVRFERRRDRGGVWCGRAVIRRRCGVVSGGGRDGSGGSLGRSVPVTGTQSDQSQRDECEAVGADLARICQEEYPECIIWSLFSRLDRSTRLPGYPGPVYPTVGHMTLGFLEFAKEHDVPCKYLCGGEVTVDRGLG